MSKAESRPRSPSRLGIDTPPRRSVGPSAAPASRTPDLLAAVAGASAGAVALGLSELLAGLVPGLPSLVVSVGALVIALQPPGAKDIVTALFGTNDKLALNVTIVAVALLIATGAGIVARRDFRRAIGVYLVVGAFAVFAAASDPLASAPLAVVNVAIAVAAGLAALRYLLGLAGLHPAWTTRASVGGTTHASVGGATRVGVGGATRVGVGGAARASVGAVAQAAAGDTRTAQAGGSGAPAAQAGSTGAGARATPIWTPDDALGNAGSQPSSHLTPGAALPPFPGPTPMPDWARRRFLIQAGGFMAAAAVAGFVGRSLLDRPTATQKASVTNLPPAGETVPPLTAGQSIQAPGISPIVTPNGSFYRIDTELIVPRVSAAGWHLDITGMVDHPLTFSYTDLLKLPLFEQYVTLACVSNPVGGPLVGNALWTGVRLKQLLSMAGVRSGASQIVGRAVDGFTVGFPTSWALDPAREPMVVVGMNRQLLPANHGYPARLIVPGLYGYVSATKWLTQIELTTEQAFNAYWVDLGWNKLGPMLTQSRIDHPQAGAHVQAGTVEVDGVAWAGDRGVRGVQIQVDDGPWQDAELSRAISKATWVQWLVRWQATPGDHTIQVRAIDGTGAVQTAQVGGPGPGGATGYDAVDLFVG